VLAAMAFIRLAVGVAAGGRDGTAVTASVRTRLTGVAGRIVRFPRKLPCVFPSTGHALKGFRNRSPQAIEGLSTTRKSPSPPAAPASQGKRRTSRSLRRTLTLIN